MLLGNSPECGFLELGPALTLHAREQMRARRLTGTIVRMVLRHGRVVYTRGAAIHVIGRKEVSRLGRSGVDLVPCEGVQVVCTPDGKAILTVYKNSDFRGLKPHGRRRRRRQPTGTLYPLTVLRLAPHDPAKP